MRARAHERGVYARESDITILFVRIIHVKRSDFFNPGISCRCRTREEQGKETRWIRSIYTYIFNNYKRKESYLIVVSFRMYMRHACYLINGQ